MQRIYDIPPGWKFRVKTLDRDLTVAPPPPDRLALVMQDNFYTRIKGAAPTPPATTLHKCEWLRGTARIWPADTKHIDHTVPLKNERDRIVDTLDMLPSSGHFRALRAAIQTLAFFIA